MAAPRRPALSAVPEPVPDPASEPLAAAPRRRARRTPAGPAAASGDLGGLEAVSAAIERGDGLFEVLRAAARALDASLALLDASGARLAIVVRSPADERALSGGPGTPVSGGEEIELRVGDESVGRLRARWRGAVADPARVALVRTLVASELQRRRAPARASRQAAAELVALVVGRRPVDRAELVARGREAGIDFASGGSAVVVRAHPQATAPEDWRGRALAVAEGAGRAAAGGALAATMHPDSPGGDVILVLVPGADDAMARRAASAILRELGAALHGFGFAAGRSRPAADPLVLAGAADEALLAANVAEGEGDRTLLDFSDIGAYRVLLPYVRSDPAELRRFYADTVEPLVAYDEQYETSSLVRTLETYLAADGVVADTAERLFTHRHTVRYRLERIRDLCGLDVNSSDGRERLSLGLKAMRVLGITEPKGPATEAGTSGGRVRGPRRRER